MLSHIQTGIQKKLVDIRPSPSVELFWTLVVSKPDPIAYVFCVCGGVHRFTSECDTCRDLCGQHGRQIFPFYFYK